MSFVYFRLPHSRQVYRNALTDEPEEIASIAELNDRRGFVIAPFSPSDKCPILLLPAKWEPMDIDDAYKGVSANLIDTAYEDERSRYNVDFANYHAQLTNGSFDKIVLARSAQLKATEHIDPLSLFARACLRYPRMFIALFGTHQSGTWLVATPEVLVNGHKGDMHTMALAGTMRLAPRQLDFDTPGGRTTADDIHWSEKNKAEQHYVETYITECIEHFATEFDINGPYTTRAGDLVHLRSDIRFKLDDTSHMGDMINAIHPTPAVCGIPKDTTRTFITDNESEPRRYYSGFVGMLNPDGDTNLFVTLRCMTVIGDGHDTDMNPTPTNKPSTYRLYAGGGLLRDSSEQDEWDETEAKMNTMRQLFKYV